MNPTIACYVRVSSRRQRTDSQRAEIEQWLARHGFDPGSVLWFEDKETGKTLKREAFEQLQAAIFEGRVKTVIVWKLDRISRCLKEGIATLANWCEREVRVVSVTQQIDLSGAVGSMIASVMFGLAEIELEYRRERQVAGIKVAKERGVYKGRQKGTTKAKPQRARELRDRGLTAAEIANALNTSERTVFRYLNLSLS
ncbi:recombinase family protein [Cyanobacteria bacterium FACHB-DQ100]|nr:recombinase family protein [Cyanobacteria bacterium FACHB-DQ100]